MTEVFPIILNQSNYVENSDNTFTYKFPRPIYFKNAEIGISRINMFYSWENINLQHFNNSTFQLSFPEGGANAIRTVTIPNGNYTIEDLNAFLQQWSITNNKYLYNTATKKNVYYIELLANPQRYTIQLVLYELPTALPVGFTNPGNMVFPTAAGLRPSLITLNNEFPTLIGFAKNTVYNAAETESSVTPEMSPVSSVIVTCSLVNNKLSNPNNIIYTFVSGSASYGSMLSIGENSDISYINIPEGLHSEVTIKFLSDKKEKLYIKDTSLIIYLIIRIKNAA